jgi:hypothetical protein
MQSSFESYEVMDVGTTRTVDKEARGAWMRVLSAEYTELGG